MKEKIKKIAKEVLYIETLEVRNSDSLDFYDLSVNSVRKALEMAYKAGQIDVIRNVKRIRRK